MKPDGQYVSYQLIRNVLAAHALGLAFAYCWTRVAPI
jgi:hypothetical protein